MEKKDKDVLDSERNQVTVLRSASLIRRRDVIIMDLRFVTDDQWRS